MKYPIIDNVYGLLFNDRKGIRREACWVLSNLSANSSNNAITLLSNEPLVKRLVELFRDDAAEVKK
jgi:hypothetical protein